MSALFASGLLSGRRALVTGGGTGICRGIALALASAGCDVAISSRRPEHLSATADDITALALRRRLDSAPASPEAPPSQETAHADATVHSP